MKDKLRQAAINVVVIAILVYLSPILVPLAVYIGFKTAVFDDWGENGRA